ncbi:hypothetical protein PAXRUDRAFT_832551 [Paxillus rubicundulus Ve08.2h10]|uniref:25S rRNA (uridine-N(3))-methyltransferase BMT5-like domain-containing protein n=1 Tax=Paxillus rubicundulus Ve08.2h10 TaxID=930991 RepID=A0A0D0CGP9_9AGAM|nr:hypothetical protein PAXRUDRAFT_832551 [Paxillus rubicundulus Ve08.2h10]
MGHGKKTSLKAMLQSQQIRLKAKQKAAHAAEVAERKRKSHNPGKGKGPIRQLTIPFKPTDKILLIGEGNFSFARALLVDAPSALEHLPPANVTATSYDSEEECYSKYPDAKGMVDTIKQRGVEVLFNIDATKLQKYSIIKGRRWDRIVWNFPHAGKGITDQDRNILCNQRLILDFLRSVPHCITLGPMPTIHPSRKRRKQDDDDDELDATGSDMETSSIFAATNGGVSSGRGTVLITLRNVSPYSAWDVPRLAKTPPKPSKLGEEPNPRYKLLRSFVFHRNDWKGYEHRMSKGERSHGHGRTGEGGEDRTWEFCLQD